MKTLVTTLVFALLHSITQSQTQDELNLEKYWKYRERLKTYFMKIGAEPGGSIPMSCRIPDWDAAGSDEEIDIPHSDVTTLEWRDATISLGYYYIVLATEYKLLNDAGGDTKPTLIELYYALNALNRLDLHAENYLEQDNSAPSADDLNGLFLRDDIPSGFESNWLPETMPDGYPMPDGNLTLRVDADAQGYDYDPHFDFNEENVESLDQLTTILLGLKFVHYMVDNVPVEIPELSAQAGEPVTKNLHYMAGEIVVRLLTYMNDMNQTPSNDREWKIIMPDGQLVPRGYDCTAASVPFCNFFDELESGLEGVLREPNHVQLEFREDKLCETISGLEPDPFIDADNLDNFLSDVLKTLAWNMIGNTTVGSVLEADIQVWQCAHCLDFFPCNSPTANRDPVKGPFPIQINMDFIENIWTGMGLAQLPLYVGSEEEICLFDFDPFEIDLTTSVFPGGEIEFDPDFVCFDLDGSKAVDEDNVHLLLEQSLIGGMWNHSYTEYLADNSQMFHIPMIWDVFNNFSNPQPLAVFAERDFYRDILSGAPCEGPWANPYANPVDPSLCAANGWGGPNRLFQPDNGLLGPKNDSNVGDPNYRGYYPGIDYMVYHNLYNLLWRNEPDMPVYSKNGICNCVAEITSEIQMGNTLLVKRYHEDYKNLGIPIESYLSHNLSISSLAGALEVQNDLVICRNNPEIPTILTIKNGAKLKLYNGNRITVREGNKIIIENGSELLGGLQYDNYTDNPAIIILESGSELHILNSDYTSLEGLRLEMREGSKFIVDNGTVTFTYLSESGSIQCQGGQWLMSGSVFNEYDDLAYTPLNFDDNSIITFTDCTINANNANFNLTSDCFFTLDGSTISFQQGEINCYHNSFLDIQNSSLILDESNIVFGYGSSMNQYISNVSILNNSSIEFGHFNPESEEYCHYYYTSGSLALESELSNILFLKGQLHIPANTTFQPIHPNGPSGYIEFRGSGDHELITGTNSVFKIVGDGPNDVMLKMNGYADLWNANFGAGTIILQDCKVDLTDHGRLWTDMKFQASNVTFEDTQIAPTNDGGHVQVWHTNSCTLNNCDFVGARLYTFNTKATLTTCDFSGKQSGYKATQGGFTINNSSLYECHLESQSLAQMSTVNETLFDNPEQDPQNSNIQFPCIRDESSVELRVLKSILRNGTFGVEKTGGKLTLKCNLFENLSDVAVTCRNNDLNLSSSSGAGYNHFHLVETCILLEAVQSLDLASGYNNLSGFTDMCIKGTMNRKCLAQQCDLTIGANNNYWGAAQNTYPPSPNPIGPFDPFMWSKIDLRTVPVQGTGCYQLPQGFRFCKIYLTDTQIAVPTNCGTGLPIVRPVRSLGVTSLNTTWKGYEPTAANEQFVLKDLETDPGNPLLNTTNFSGIALDSALVYAALQMEIYDSLGNDANAVALFHEILTSPLDRTNKDIRWRMEWGRYNMKSAMENMFMQDELTAANNVSTFETPVAQYVDVLNNMTDTILTDSTYKDQFYVEIDKGQLFRTLGNPLMARHIYLHLDDCQLDSLEQSILNNWRQEVDIELSLLDQYINDGISPDSISFVVDTTSYTPAIPYTTSNYYFGVWIDSPTSATFVNCGDNPEYRILRNSQNSLNVYPNPSAGLVTLQIEQEGLYDLAIYDISGKQIHARQINVGEGGGVPLDLSGVLSTGNYMIVLENDFGMMLSKLVIAD